MTAAPACRRACARPRPAAARAGRRRAETTSPPRSPVAKSAQRPVRMLTLNEPGRRSARVGLRATHSAPCRRPSGSQRPSSAGRTASAAALTRGEVEALAAAAGRTTLGHQRSRRRSATTSAGRSSFSLGAVQVSANQMTACLAEHHTDVHLAAVEVVAGVPVGDVQPWLALDFRAFMPVGDRDWTPSAGSVAEGNVEQAQVAGN